jgi:hypothetical protein
MRNIGRPRHLIGGAHVELSPEETADLQDHPQHICDREIKAWAEKRNLVGVIRDHTGVMIEPLHHSEGDNADIRRPTMPSLRPAKPASRAVIEAKLHHSHFLAGTSGDLRNFGDGELVRREKSAAGPHLCALESNKVRQRK